MVIQNSKVSAMDGINGRDKERTCNITALRITSGELLK